MKHKFIYIILAVVLIVCIISGCTAQEVSEKGTTESTTVSEESAMANESNAVQSETGSDVPIDDGDQQTPSETSGSGQKEKTTTAKQTDGKTSPTELRRNGTTATTKKQTTTKRQTTTKKQTTTTTTKRNTTTTTKKSGLSKSDVEWVQSQANAYIKSKGISVNSGVGSFSGKISSKNFSTRNDLLSYIKDEIDYEYDDCIASGWKKVEMYVKIESRTDGSYFLYVMYG